MSGRVLQVPPNSDLTLGMVCVDKSEAGTSTWSMTVDERFENPAGIMQGGFLASFCDSAMGASAVTYVKDRKVNVSNAELKISFFSAIRTGSVLTCRATVTSGSRRVAFVEATVTDQLGRVVGRATSTYIYRDRK
jgi:uncharacterized protein (TIGR00369 family)